MAVAEGRSVGVVLRTGAVLVAVAGAGREVLRPVRAGLAGLRVDGQVSLMAPIQLLASRIELPSPANLFCSMWMNRHGCERRTRDATFVPPLTTFRVPCTIASPVPGAGPSG